MRLFCAVSLFINIGEPTCKYFVSATLTERQVALEERKFCLITCEVTYNTGLVELMSLCKQSVGCADHLPKFNRRTTVAAIERGTFETDYTPVLVCRFVSIKLGVSFFVCGWNKCYRHEDLRMVSDRLKIKKNKDLSITWEGGTKKRNHLPAEISILP